MIITDDPSKKIANVAHPFNSHANDRVHDYISHILRKKAINQKDFIEIDDYSPTNVTFYRDPRSVAYFESRNIVIKFEGSRYNDSAILWGAHYDSVSLAPGTLPSLIWTCCCSNDERLGATDDGIGIVSLLQLSDYFASEQPERTMIILFNGGEEDGLNGAQV
jgi:Zn-dependent M28 family amino/carboxypeptidase